MAVNNWVPAPFSKMSTNALRTLSNTLISSKVRKQLWKQVLLHLWCMQQISNQKFRRSFRVDTMLSDNARLQLRKRPDHAWSFNPNLTEWQGWQGSYKQHSCLRVMNYPHSRQILVNWKFFLDPKTPLILSVGRGPMKLNKLRDFDWCCFALLALHSWPTAKLTAEWWGIQTYCTAPSMLNLQFLTETPQVRTGVNTLVGTNQDVWPCGYHPPSGFLFAVSQLPEMIDVSHLKYKSLPFVWRNHPKPHLMPQTAFKHLQRRTALVWGGKQQKGGRPLNVAIEMWRRQNACSDRSPSARHTANITEISTLPAGRLIVHHAIEFSKPHVRMHYSTLQRFQDMMSWINTWLAQIKTRSLHCTHAKIVDS